MFLAIVLEGSLISSNGDKKGVGSIVGYEGLLTDNYHVRVELLIPISPAHPLAHRPEADRSRPVTRSATSGTTGGSPEVPSESSCTPSARAPRSSTRCEVPHHPHRQPHLNPYQQPHHLPSRSRRS